MESLFHLMKSNDATALRKKKFTEGTLRYNLYRQAQETLNAGMDLKQVINGKTPNPHQNSLIN